MRKIPIFKQEKLDGLADQISKSMSISYCSEILECKPYEVSPEQLKILEASIAKNSEIDLSNGGLYRLDSILATVGWTKNDDIFEKSEIWISKHTADHKPFNYMHNGTDIIGHSLGHTILDMDGNILSEDLEIDSLPDKFHIAENSVLYTIWEDEFYRDRIQQIIAEIPENKWFVSAEVAFSNFDYGMIDQSTNEIKFVSRNAQTSFLTKHLLIYGGDGVYNNYRVGRVLRNMTFFGKGLVRRPANPDSIILTDTQTYKQSTSELISLSSEIVEMSDTGTEKIDSLQAEIKSLREENAKLLVSKNSELVEGLKSEVEEIKKELTSKSAQIVELEKQVESGTALAEELRKEIAKLAEDKNKSEEELKKMKKEKKETSRYQALVAVGKTDEDAKALVTKFDSLNDEMFAEFVDLFKNSKSETKDEEQNTTEVSNSAALDNAEVETETDLNSGADISKSEEDIINSMRANIKRKGKESK